MVRRLFGGGGSLERTRPLKSILAGKIPGILFVWGSERGYWIAIQHQFNGLRRNSLHIGTGNLFRPSRELVKSGIREFIRPDQGIPRWPPFPLRP